jgi:hypothetical protein
MPEFEFTLPRLQSFSLLPSSFTLMRIYTIIVLFICLIYSHSISFFRALAFTTIFWSPKEILRVRGAKEREGFSVGVREWEDFSNIVNYSRRSVPKG